MKPVDRHGLKITGLRLTSRETVDYEDATMYTEIFYDTGTGEVWTIFNCPFGSEWRWYRDPAVIHVCDTSRHMTMQEIADAIRDALEELN